MSSTFTQAGGTFNAGDTLIDNNGTGATTISGGTFNLQSATLESTRAITVSGATTSTFFDGGTGNITLVDITYGDLFINGGDFTFPNGNVTIKDDLTISVNAIVNENNTTLTYSSSNAVATIDIPSTFTFTNLIVSSTANTYGIVISPGDTFIVSSTLTLVNGIIGGTGVLEFTGPESGLTLESTWDGGSGTLKISGDDIRDFTFDATTKFPGIYLNAPNTTIDFLGTASTTIGGGLTIDAGEFNVSSTDIILNSGTYGSITQTGGIFNGQNTGLISVARSFFLSGGTFNAGTNSGSLNIDGNYTNTITGGTFNLQTATANVDYPLTVSNGIFDGGTGNLTFVIGWADLTISGGTFTFPSGTTTIKNNLTIGAGATIYYNNATLVHNRTYGVSGYGYWNISGTSTIANLVINNLGPNYLVTYIQTGAIVVSSTLTLTDGYLTGASGTSLEFSGDNINIASTWDGLNIPTFRLTGNNNQIIDITGIESSINSDVIINKASGTVTLNSGLTLDAASQDLTITDGVLDLNGNNLLIVGVFSNNDTLRLQGSETLSFTNDTDSGTIEFIGNADSLSDTYIIPN
ncbi:MAG: hypothetical protein ACD_19C00081G0001, partial [uncultured bacterium]